MRDQGVDKHVGGAGVEGEDLLRLGRARKNRNVGDAAEVERNAAEFRVAIEKVVHIRNKWRSLATEGDVRRSKITDGRDARASRDDGRLADLQRRGGRSAQKIDGLALMEDGLPVTSDQGDLRWRHSETTASGQGGVAEEFSQTEIQLTESAGGDGVLFSDTQNFVANRGRKFDGGVAEKLRVQLRRRAGDAGESHVNAIGGSAGHHAENEHGLSAHEICFFSSARRLSASSGFNWSRSAPRSLSRTSRSSAVKSTC